MHRNDHCIYCTVRIYDPDVLSSFLYCVPLILYMRWQQNLFYLSYSKSWVTLIFRLVINTLDLDLNLCMVLLLIQLLSCDFISFCILWLYVVKEQVKGGTGVIVRSIYAWGPRGLRYLDPISLHSFYFDCSSHSPFLRRSTFDPVMVVYWPHTF